MKPAGSWPHSQQSGTCPYPETDYSTPIAFRTIYLLLIHHSLGFPSGPFPAGSRAKTLYAFFSFPTDATFPAHLILPDVKTLLIFNE
jgi:hypothetical protein